jgi:hypothetical protein
MLFVLDMKVSKWRLDGELREHHKPDIIFEIKNTADNAITVRL